MSKFCPDWLYNAVCALVARRYLESNLPLTPIADRYSKILSEKYSAITTDNLEVIAEAFLRIIVETESDNAVDILNAFIYRNLVFTPRGDVRKYKGLFSNALDGTKTQEYSADSAIKKFRPFVFMVRAKPEFLSPPGWNMGQIADADWVNTLHEVEISILDSL